MVKVKEFALGWVIKLNVFFFLVTLGVKILRTDLAYKCVKASRFQGESLVGKRYLQPTRVFVDMFL